MVRVDDGGRAAQVGDGIGYAHTFTKCHYANLNFKQIDIEFQENVAGYFLF